MTNSNSICKCGATNPETATYCNKCGRKLRKSIDNSSINDGHSISMVNRCIYSILKAIFLCSLILTIWGFFSYDRYNTLDHPNNEYYDEVEETWIKEYVIEISDPLSLSHYVEVDTSRAKCLIYLDKRYKEDRIRLCIIGGIGIIVSGLLIYLKRNYRYVKRV